MPRLFATLIAIVLAGQAGATTLLRASIEDLARASHSVVTGRVLATRCERDARTGLIVTIATLERQLAIAGAAVAERIDVQTLGGTLGRVHQGVDGEARLSPGDDVALFLRRLPGGRLAVAGMVQGQLQVVSAASGLRVSRTGGYPVLHPAAGGYVPLEPLDLALEDFTKRVWAARGEP
jgi:hypothetical protein